MITEQKQPGILIYLFIAYVLLYFCVFELAAIARFILWIVQGINWNKKGQKTLVQ